MICRWQCEFFIFQCMYGLDIILDIFKRFRSMSTLYLKIRVERNHLQNDLIAAELVY